MKFHCEHFPSLIASDGKTSVRFQDGVYETDDPAEIELLDGCAKFVVREGEKPAKQPESKKDAEPAKEPAPDVRPSRSPTRAPATDAKE